ncbi:MAG: hypothetical protein MI743_22535 [Sneathiellales bacterium]|nr:hypothetical protein [Sneathiellales bacterium]
MIEDTFQQVWKEAVELCGTISDREIPNAPSLWKGVGDELIYSFCLNEPEDVIYVLMAWVKTLHIYRKQLKIRNPELDIKGCAWVADFPVDNAEIVISREIKNQSEKYPDEDPKFYHFKLLEAWYENENTSPQADLVKDYIGPAIDTGFRLAELATPQKFITSLETALLISSAQNNIPGEYYREFFGTETGLQIHFENMQSLKGVLGGKPYPVFWIDLLSENDELTKSLHKLENLTPPRSEDIKNFCEVFLKENDSQFIYPFIYQSKSPLFRRIPENYEATLNRLSERWKAEKTRLEKRYQSLRENDAPLESGSENVSDNPKKINLPKPKTLK